jgi:hypothetical protein
MREQHGLIRVLIDRAVTAVLTTVTRLIAVATLGASTSSVRCAKGLKMSNEQHLID